MIYLFDFRVGWYLVNTGLEKRRVEMSVSGER